MTAYTVHHTKLYLWTEVIAGLTLIFGFCSLATGFGLVSDLPVSADIPGGCILLLLGLLCITGLVEGRQDPVRWVQYGYTGMLLLIIFGISAFLIAGANAITMMIGGKFADMSLFYGSGFIWGAILALPAYPGLRRILIGCSRGELHE